MKTDYPLELSLSETPQSPEVTLNGQKVTMTEAVDEIYQLVNMANIAKVRKYFDDRTSEGFVQNWNLTVTPVVQEVICDYPAQSFYIINDGASPIFVEINRRHKTATQLLMGEDMPLDFETHKLKRFYVYCGPGGAATARAAAKR